MTRFFSSTFLVLVFLCSCRMTATDEQNKEFNDAKKILLENKSTYMSLMTLTPTQTDSVRRLLDDLEKNNLDQMVEKYKLTGSDVKTFIMALSMSANLTKVEIELDQGEKTSKNFDSIYDKVSKLDSSDFKFDKLNKQIDTSNKK